MSYTFEHFRIGIKNRTRHKRHSKLKLISGLTPLFDDKF